jgi:hypothetical protein
MELALPPIDDFDLELDLVAEAVTWFELRGVNPLVLPFRGRLYHGTGQSAAS